MQTIATKGEQSFSKKAEDLQVKTLTLGGSADQEILLASPAVEEAVEEAVEDTRQWRRRWRRQWKPQ